MGIILQELRWNAGERGRSCSQSVYRRNIGHRDRQDVILASTVLRRLLSLITNCSWMDEMRNKMAQNLATDLMRQYCQSVSVDVQSTPRAGSTHIGNTLLALTVCLHSGHSFFSLSQFMMQPQSNMCPHSVTALVPASGVRSSMQSVHLSKDSEIDSTEAARSWAVERSSLSTLSVPSRDPVDDAYASDNLEPGGIRSK